MTRSTIFDRLNQELEAFGRKAQSALDEGKLQIELLRARRRRDNAAKDLGLLIYRRERGTEVEPRRVDALLLRLDDDEREIARLEHQIGDTRHQRSDAAPPVPAERPGAQAGASPSGS